MFIAGLALTVAGWLIQLYQTVIKKDSHINMAFLGLYLAGCVLLTVDNFTNSAITDGVLNGLDVLIPLGILTFIIFTRKTA